MDPLMIITICLITSLVLAELFNFLRTSAVIGLIFAGILLGIPPIKEALFGATGVEYVSFLANLGIVFLLLITGLEIDFNILKKSKKEEIWIAMMAAIIPFVLGFITSYYLLHFNFISSFIIGAALSMTAEGTKVVILMELNKLNSRIGTIMIGAGILDDIFEIITLSAVIILAHKGLTTQLLLLPVKILIFVVIIMLLFKIILPRITKYVFVKDSQVNSLGIIIVFTFLIASLSQYLELGPIIGAFIAGILLQMFIKHPKVKDHLKQQIKDLSFALIIPFFFISIGLNFDISSIFTDPYLFIIILIIATLGKMVGTLTAGIFLKKTLTFKQLLLIGWGMNSRGAVELVIISIAKNAGFLSADLYSALVLVAVTTTFIFPFVLRYYVKKYPHIME